MTQVILDQRLLTVSAVDLSAAILVPGAIRQRKETFVRIESGNIWLIVVPASRTRAFSNKNCNLVKDHLRT